MSVLTVYATLTGTNREQLSIRLSWLARQYVRYTVTKPGRPARLDAFSEEAQSVADALDDAVRLLVDEHTAARRAELVHAVRLAEDRWQKVQVDLHRAGTTWADLRARPGYQRELPTQRATSSTPRRHLTLVPDRPSTDAGLAASQAADKPATGRSGPISRMVDNITAGPATDIRELSRQR